MIQTNIIHATQHIHIIHRPVIRTERNPLPTHNPAGQAAPAVARNTSLTHHYHRIAAFGRKTAPNDRPYLFLNILLVDNIFLGHVARYVQTDVDVTIHGRCNRPLLQGRHFCLCVCACVSVRASLRSRGRLRKPVWAELPG